MQSSMQVAERCELEDQYRQRARRSARIYVIRFVVNDFVPFHQLCC